MQSCVLFWDTRYKLQKFGDFLVYGVAKWAGGYKLSVRHGCHRVSLKELYKTLVTILLITQK